MRLADNSVAVVILAGGRGTRFWPLSRARKPKQFLALEPNGESLIQATARRVAGVANRYSLWAVTNVEQTALVHQDLPEARVLVEPVGRNTAASIGLAATYIAHTDPESVMVILPSDHVIQSGEEFVAALRRAITVAANKDVLVTLGIEPTGPCTAYGYIKRGKERGERVYEVARFFEKPSSERATQYIESGDFYWNSGMFAWRASTILSAIAEFLPELSLGLAEIGRAIGTSDEAQVTQRIFPELENISVDIGILEHARNCEVVVGNGFSWSDVGAWDSWAALFPCDSNNNMLRGDVETLETSSCVVVAEGRNISLLGVEDLVVIDTPDALLICPRSRVQDVGKMVDHLRKQGRTDLL